MLRKFYAYLSANHDDLVHKFFAWAMIIGMAYLTPIAAIAFIVVIAAITIGFACFLTDFAGLTRKLFYAGLTIGLILYSPIIAAMTLSLWIIYWLFSDFYKFNNQEAV